MLIVSLLFVALLAPPVAAQPADGEVEFTGGGWGHGVGLSQYGAQGMALDGYSSTQIATHYFTGTSVAQMAGTLPADSFLLTDSEPLWVGLLQNRWSFKFRAVGGDLELCQRNDGEGACPKSVTPHDGELWTFTFNGSNCRFEYGGLQGNSGDCFASISWGEGTRVELPDLGLSFAHGTLKIRPVGTLPTLKFHVSLAIDVDDYVRGIDEMPASWEPAALQAQAMAARTYAVAKAQQRETGTRSGTLRDPALLSYWESLCWCHVRATSVDQNYDGWDQEQRASWVAAADATAGQVLTRPNSEFTKNDVIEAFYSSSTSGVTETITGGFEFPSPYPYLQSVDDHWSQDPRVNNSYSSWTKTVSIDTVIAKLASAGKASFDTLTSVVLVNGPPEATVRFTGTVSGALQSVDVPGWWLRSQFGLASPQVTGVSMGAAAPVSRLWGQDRYATATAISQQSFPSGASIVYVATGENFPDALAAAPAAFAEGAPILLTMTDLLPSATKTELDRLNPSRIVVLGGSAAVSDSVAKQLKAYAPEVVRRAGSTRFETAVEVSKAVFDTNVPVVYLVPGFQFPEALSAGAAAAVQGGPVLAVHPLVIPTAVKDELKRLKPRRIVLVGDTSAISSDVEAQLSGYTSGSVERIAGSNIYQTSVNVSSAVFGPGVSAAFVARGDLFADGLAAGPAAARAGGPVLLVSSNEVPVPVGAELTRLLPHVIHIAGGEGAVSAAVEEALAAYVQ